MAARGVRQKVRPIHHVCHSIRKKICLLNSLLYCIRVFCLHGRHSPPAVADAAHWELLLSVVRNPYLDS